MLPNAPNDRTKSTLHLPIDTIVEHVEQDNGLVPHEHVLIAKQLDKDLLDELESAHALDDAAEDDVLVIEEGKWCAHCDVELTLI